MTPQQHPRFTQQVQVRNKGVSEGPLPHLSLLSKFTFRLQNNQAEPGTFQNFHIQRWYLGQFLKEIIQGLSLLDVQPKTQTSCPPAHDNMRPAPT
jgi:hypothetical protein